MPILKTTVKAIHWVNMIFRHCYILSFSYYIYLFVLKDKLHQLFPDWDSIRRHEEVIRFACGLTAESLAVLEFVYDVLIQKLLNKNCNREDIAFLNSLLKEVPEEVALDIFHNRFLNVLEYSDNDKDIFIPSRYYMFRNLRNTCECIRFHIAEPTEPGRALSAEGMLVAGSNERLYEIMTVIRKVCRYQQICINWLDIYDVECSPEDSVCDDSVKLLFKTCLTTSFLQQCTNLIVQKQDENNVTAKVLREMMDDGWKNIGVENHITFMTELLTRKYQAICEMVHMDRGGLTKLILDTITISKNIKVLTMQTKVLSPAAYRHIVHQLYGCEKLEKLNLSETVGVPEELCRCVAEMKSLTKLDMELCCMVQSMSELFMKALSHCSSLTKVFLHGNQLSGCLGNLFSGSGFPSLQELSLDFTGLAEEDLLSLSRAARDGKLPRLKELCLSRNKLADSIKHLMENSVFPALVKLELQNTFLTQSDLMNLSSALALGHLPKLVNLNLSQNKLTDNMINFFTTDELSLQHLWLSNTQLSKDDIKSISRASSNGKLPALRGLSLSGNTMTGCMRDLLGSEDQPTFPSLEWLYMQNTQPSREDLVCLTEGIKAGKISKLWELRLQQNNLNCMENEVEHLIKICVTFHGQRHLTLNINDNNLSYQLRNKVESVYRGTNLAVCWDVIVIDID